jgi:hypothetical protein
MALESFPRVDDGNDDKFSCEIKLATLSEMH